MTTKSVKRIILSTSRTTLKTECIVPGSSETVNERHIREKIKDVREVSIIDETDGLNDIVYSKKMEEDTDTDTIEYEITEDKVSRDTGHYLMNAISSFERDKVEPGSLHPTLAIKGNKPLKTITSPPSDDSKLRDKLKTLPESTAKRYFERILDDFITNNIKQEGCIRIDNEMFHFEFLNTIVWRSVCVR